VCACVRACVRVKVIHEKKYALLSIRYIMAEYFPYVDDLANMIGCSPPNFCKLISSAFVYFMFYNSAWFWEYEDKFLSYHVYIAEPMDFKTYVKVSHTLDCRKFRIAIFHVLSALPILRRSSEEQY